MNPTDKYAVIRKEGGGYKVYLKVNHQSFCVTEHAYDNRRDANWMRKQLMTALKTMMTEAKKGG